MYEIHVEHGSNEWRNWRRGLPYVDLDGVVMAGVADGGPRITATMASIIGGHSPFRTPEALWGEMMGLRHEQSDNFVIKRGREHEDFAKKAYCNLVGEEIESLCIQSSQHDWIGASLDGIDIMRTMPVEVKCPISEKEDGAFAQAQNNVVVQHYYDQIQWQHLASDNQFNSIRYFVFAPQIGAAPIIDVPVDLDRQAYLLEKVIAFRTAIMERIPLCGTEFEQAAKTYLLLKQRHDDLSVQVDQFKNALKKMANNKPLSGGGVSVSVSVKKAKTQWDKVLELLQKDCAIEENRMKEVCTQFTTTKIEETMNFEEVVKTLASVYAVEAKKMNQWIEMATDAPTITTSLRETVEAPAILNQLRSQAIALSLETESPPERAEIRI